VRLGSDSAVEFWRRGSGQRAERHASDFRKRDGRAESGQPEPGHSSPSRPDDDSA